MAYDFFMAARVTLKSPAQEQLVRALVEVTSDLSAKELKRPTTSVLATIIERLAERMLPSSAPLAKARLRGVLAQRELVDAEGGALTGNELATLLHVTRQAVDKRRKAGRLLALELPKRGYLYPAWQFTDDGVLQGLAEVLAALPDDSPWAKARFFVAGNDRLGGRRPVDVLREGDVMAVLRSAEMSGEHGAA